jgi:Transglutaminase-like superfamily/Coenzyme PQQ synthesis protein D (PqqD)
VVEWPNERRSGSSQGCPVSLVSSAHLNAGNRQKVRSGVFWTDCSGTTVILDMNSGKYLAFDKVGSYIWSLVDGALNGAQIASSVASRYQVDSEKASEDVRAFLSKLSSMKLIEPTFKIEKDSDGSGQFETAREGRNNRSIDDSHECHVKPAIRVRRWWRGSLSIEAYAMLILTDLGLNALGFQGMWRRFTKSRRKPSSVANSDAVTDLTAIALSAFKWYRPGIACMHRAFAAYWFLRRHGIPAELCLGVKTCPFSSHAWVEFQGRVLDDSSHVKDRFRIIAKVA